MADQLTVTIEGFEMPGKSCAPDDAGERYENVHVGVQRKQDPVDLFSGDKLAGALDQGGLHIRVRMRDEQSNPRCARVRDAEWRAFTTA